MLKLGKYSICPGKYHFVCIASIFLGLRWDNIHRINNIIQANSNNPQMFFLFLNNLSWWTNLCNKINILSLSRFSSLVFPRRAQSSSLYQYWNCVRRCWLTLVSSLFPLWLQLNYLHASCSAEYFQRIERLRDRSGNEKLYNSSQNTQHCWAAQFSGHNHSNVETYSYIEV